jgi:hypothetical protein
MSESSMNLSPPADSASPTQPATCNLDLSTPVAARRLKGKIPSLPKAQRDTINRLLLDGATYALVIQRMAEEGVSLNAENLSNWYTTGFQDYLAGLERLDYHRARYEAAADLLQDTDTAKLPEAGLQTAAAQIYDLLGSFTPAALAEKMTEDPDKYTRLLNALSRLARESLALQKHRDANAQARATLSELKDPKRKLSESERRAIVLQVDDILGLSSPEDDESEPGDQVPGPSVPSSSSIGSPTPATPAFATPA